MNFFKKLFRSERPYVDKDGIYFHVQCRQCQAVVRSRIDKKHDLNQDGEGFIWHKVIVDSRCFQQMRTIVRFNAQYQVIDTQIEGGNMISDEQYKTVLANETTNQLPNMESDRNS